MQKTYAFGEFVVRPAQRLLTRRSGETVDIHAKAFDALICLVQRPGEVVSRAELARSLWPRVVVEDNNLSQTIRALRLALGDTGPTYRFITTVPRQGYQFIATMDAQDATAGTRVARATMSPTGIEPDEVEACRARSAESSESARPRVSSLAIFFACVAGMALLVTIMTRWPPASGAEAPASPSSRPVADTVVEGSAPSWPLPEVVACLPEAARQMDPERCAAAIESVQRAERRRKQGLHTS